MSLSLSDQSPAGIDKWIAALSIPDAPARRDGIRTALAYFTHHLPVLTADTALSFLRCMDLSKPVSVVFLNPGEKLIAARLPAESPFKLFYTRPGRSMTSTGINPADRTTRSFTVRVPFQALESYTTGAKDSWTKTSPGIPVSFSPRDGGTFGYLASGGAVQLIVPDAVQRLQLDG